jgi:hypothetical protein
MPASQFALFHGGKEAIGDGTIDLSDASAGIFKAALASSSWTPSLSGNDVWSDISANEITGDGYTAGGQALTSVTWTDSSGTMKWDADDPSWTAGASGIAARYVVLYHVASGKLITYSLLDTTPADHSVTNGQVFLVTLPATGIFQLA